MAKLKNKVELKNRLVREVSQAESKLKSTSLTDAQRAGLEERKALASEILVDYLKYVPNAGTLIIQSEKERVFKDCLKAYGEFCQVELGYPADISSRDCIAMRKIIEYYFESSANWDRVLSFWVHVLSKWNRYPKNIKGYPKLTAINGNKFVIMGWLKKVYGAENRSGQRKEANQFKQIAEGYTNRPA